MNPITLLNILLLMLNVYFAYTNYKLENYKTSIFSAFVCGCLFASLLDAFLNCA